MIAYAVTDPATLDFCTIEEDMARFASKADMIVYRDKENKNCTYDAHKFMKEARKYSFEKILIHTEIALAKNLDADGVHLASTQYKEIPLAKEAGLFVIVSTHSIKEAKKAESLGADMVTYSPIFESPGKGKAVGLQMLREVVSNVDIPVIALGGILNEKQIEACQMSGAKGFASIRYFA